MNIDSIQNGIVLDHIAAGKALPSAADAGIFIGGAGIDDLALGMTAKRTLHGKQPPDRRP